MEMFPHLRNTLNHPGPHTELLVFFNQHNVYFRFLWEEVPHILPPHLSWNTFSPVTVAQWRINYLYFTTEGESLCTDDYGALCVPERGLTCLDVTQDQSPDVTPEDFPWLLGARVPCVDKHRVPRGTPVFEVDTATLSDYYLLLHHKLSNHSYFPLQLTAVKYKIIDNSVTLTWQPQSPEGKGEKCILFSCRCRHERVQVFCSES